MSHDSDSLWKSISDIFVSNGVEDLLNEIFIDNVSIDIIEKYIDGEYLIDDASGIFNSVFNFSIEFIISKVNDMKSKFHPAVSSNHFRIPLDSLNNMKKIVCYCLYYCVNSSNLQLSGDGGCNIYNTSLINFLKRIIHYLCKYVCMYVCLYRYIYVSMFTDIYVCTVSCMNICLNM